jgi:hypothetical protein
MVLKNDLIFAANLMGQTLYLLRKNTLFERAAIN